jgi:hypothetical protein
MGGEDQILYFKIKFGAFTVELIAYWHGICSTCSNILKKQYSEVLFTTKKLNGIFGRGPTKIKCLRWNSLAVHIF